MKKHMKNNIVTAWSGILIFLLFLFTMPLRDTNAQQLTTKTVTALPGDTSTELQKLLDYNKYGQFDLIVEIPEGTYELNAELKIYSNTTIKADSKAYIKKNNLRGAMIANDMSNDQGGYGTGVNITIDGGVWDSANVVEYQQGTESFRFIHASNVTVSNATICNVPDGSHLVTFAGVKNGTIEGCKLYGYKGTMLKEAIHLDIVHDNKVVPSTQYKYITYDDLVCDGIVIKNNEIYDYVRGIGSHSSVSGVYHKNIEIKSNNIHDIKEAGIKAYQYVNVTISDNTIQNTAVGILAYSCIENAEESVLTPLATTVKEATPSDYKVTIANNTIKSMKQYKSGKIVLWGDGIRIIGTAKQPIPGIILKKNTIQTTERYGIFMEGAPKAIVSENKVISTTKNAIYLINGCNQSKVKFNTVKNAGATGSEEGGIGISDSKKVMIYKNTVTKAAKNGIFLYNASTDCTIKKNKVSQAADNGISVNLSSNGAVITENMITGCKTVTRNNRGIFVYGADKATISKNVISSCLKKQEINTNNSIGSKVYSNTIR